jgi:hypothetical protein
MSLFQREDWTIFRNLSTITHKAGVPLKHLRRLVVKELVDNALDANPGQQCQIEEKADLDLVSVTDFGSGIPGTPEEIATLFSIRRPLTSSKILRLPSRGALGNGLRVVSGVVLASGGKLIVNTRGMNIGIDLHEDGTATPNLIEGPKIKGTCVVVRFGDGVPRDDQVLSWGTWANDFAQAKTYKGKSNPYWYDSDSFYELMKAAGELNIFDLVQMFDGIKDGKGMLADLSLPMNPASFTRDDADKLLAALRSTCKPVDPKNIGRIADKPTDYAAYHRVFGTCDVAPGRGQHHAVLPYCIEAIAAPRKKEEKDDILFAYVNGTPITGDMYITRTGKGEISMFGCGVRHRINRVSTRKFQLELNITIPYMPITTDGKAPDFGRFLGDIAAVTQKASRKLKANLNKGNEKSTIILNNLKAGVRKASGNGKYRYSLRQLYYALRPYVMEESGEDGELDYTHFASIITKIESDAGDLPGMYRDPRGVLYHPHTQETIPIGTIAVEQYKRPVWTFRHVLYIEKEGLFEVLKQAHFPERYDCALLSSKGFASRAVRDLIDLLGEHHEDVNVYCLHDADGPGTKIYEALQEGTLAREARKIKIHNLGLEPWEGLEMGLQVEEFGERKAKVVTATYVNREYMHKGVLPEDFKHPESKWSEWLQTKRIELNSMTSPEFLEWIEKKFNDMGVEKVMPPVEVLHETYRTTAEAEIRRALSHKILKEAGIDGLVAKGMTHIHVPTNIKDLTVNVLKHDREERWSDPVNDLAHKAALEAAEKAK